MANLTIDVKDLTVPELSHTNIAVINQPNPVENFSATDDQIFFLINFPKYKMTESATGKIITGENYYEYFPDKDPHGGGGGSLIEKSITANGLYKAKDDNAKGYSSVDVNVAGGSIYAGSAPTSCRGSNMVGPYGYKVIDE